MKKTSFLIAGKHAVTEALKNPRRNVLKVLLTEDSKKILNKDNQDQNLLKNIKIFYKTKKELDRLCSKDQISHQGLIAEIEHFNHLSIKEYLSINENKKGFELLSPVMPDRIIATDKEVGNIKDIWEGRKINAVRTAHVNDRVNKIKICKKCDFKETFNWLKVDT